MLTGILAGCLTVCVGFAACAHVRDGVERYVRIALGTPRGRDLEYAANDFRRLAALDNAITRAHGCLRDWGLRSYADRLRNWQRRARQDSVLLLEILERGRRAGLEAAPIPAVHDPAQGEPAHGQPAHGQPAHGQPARQSSGSSDSPPVSGELTVSAVTPPRAARRRASASPQPQPSSRAQRSGAGPSTSSASPSNRRSLRPR
jgi:hypothetical protein